MIVALVVILLPVLAAAQDDPCGFTKPPRPARLELARLDAQAKDSAFKTALLDMMDARNALDAADNGVTGKNQAALVQRMGAERERDRSVRESAELSKTKADLAGVCGEILQLRMDLTSSDAKRVHEIDLLRDESKVLRARMAADPESRYRAETERLLADAKNVQAAIKNTAANVAAMRAVRDRLKAGLAKQ